MGNQPDKSLNSVSPTVNKRNYLGIVIGLVLALTALYGVYYWQNSKVKDATQKLKAANTQVVALKASQNAATAVQPTAPASTDSINTDLIPGQAEMTRSDGRLLITGVYKTTNIPQELWLDYGATPTNLDKSTLHATKGLGEVGPTDAYSFGQSLEIPKVSVTAGQTYFYRVSAKLDGKTSHSAIASFTVSK
ncbi:MAG: hypothetical protein ABIQ89_00860 [Candidatus Saccharimonadales bacterium]